VPPAISKFDSSQQLDKALALSNQDVVSNMYYQDSK
jgi:hypothetical protein